MSRLGMADLGLANMSDMLQNASLITSINPAVPVIADADTGYGGPLNVAHTVRSYARAGVAALHIEDQVQEKRCGHLAGKLLVSKEIFYSRLRAAVKARDEIIGDGKEMMLIARTDARAGKDVEGNGGFDEAVVRLKGAIDVGVDAVFLEALQTPEECKVAVEAFKGTPVLLNMVPGGKTPIISNEEANKLGFRIVIWPTLSLEAVVPAIERAMKQLKDTGKYPQNEEMGPNKLFEVCGLRDLMAFDSKVGGKAYQDN